MHGFSTIDIYSSRLIWLWPSLNSQSVSNRDQYWATTMVPLPGMISQLPSAVLIKLDHFHHGNESILFLLEKILWIPACNASAQTYRMLDPPSWYSTQHCFWSKNSLHRKRRIAMIPCSWNSLSLLYSPASWSSRLVRSVEWSSAESVAAKWQCLAGVYMLGVSVQYMFLW